MLLMTEGRGQQAIPKVNYWLLHLGESEEDNGDGENKEISEICRTETGIVLVKETPLTTPTPGQNELDSEAGKDTTSSSEVIPESQLSQGLGLDTNMVDNLFNELNEAEIQERRSKLEAERVEVECRARLLTEQTELEAKERQVVLMKKQIEELMEARKKAQEAPTVLNWVAIGDD